MPTSLSVLCLALVLTPSTQAQTPDPATGTTAARLSGEWVGAFECGETGEHGVLVVRFGPNDGFFGGFLVVPGPYPDALFPEPVPLALDLLSATGDTFRASLVRYDEDEWADPLDTTLRGTLVRQDRLEGTINATGAMNETVPQCGRWWASKTPLRLTVSLR